VWDDVIPYIRQRPILGYGYGGFWTPTHINDISEEEKWGVAASHSAYLDCLLALSLIGGIYRSFRYYRHTRDPGFAFGGALILYFALDGVLDSIILGVSLLMFVCMVVLTRIGFVDRIEDADRLRHPPNETLEIAASSGGALH
jgi:hypothetical protein